MSRTFSSPRGQPNPWLIALGLSLGPAVGNGLARFAYGLVLPAMQADLGWTYTQAGWINTANALGYLAGALLTLALLDRAGARRVFLAGMLLSPLALAGSALSGDLWVQSAFRLAAGLTGAAAFIAGSAMVSALFRGDAARNALAISVYFGGGGLGMLLSGAALPLLIDGYGVQAWPVAWLYLAGLAAASVLPAVLAARAGPQPAARLAGQARALPLGNMGLLISAYFLFGVGYIVYLTFLVAHMRTSAASATQVALAWSILSLGVMAAPSLWRRLLARVQGGGALGLACLATGSATLLPLPLPGSTATLMLSVLVFGLSFFMAPTAVTAFVRKNLAEHLWGRAMALFTTVFAVGQVIGPTLAGYVADLAGTLVHGMALAGVVLIAAGLAALGQKRLSPAHAEPARTVTSP